MTIPIATSALAAQNADPPLTLRWEARFWRVCIALFLGGFATFAVLYCVQPMLPAFARAFSLSPAAASLSLSAATSVLAVAMFGAGALSDAIGRKMVMAGSLAAASAATFAIAFVPNWPTLIALRALAGLALAGVPAVAMAYIAEDMDRSAVGPRHGPLHCGQHTWGHGRPVVGRRHRRSRGLARGHRRGRRLLLRLLGRCSPCPCRRSGRQCPGRDALAILPAIRLHLSDPGLRYLYALGFLVMGAFVTTYNYIGFRLAAPPFSLSQASIGFVFVIYLVGAVVSPVGRRTRRSATAGAGSSARRSS